MDGKNILSSCFIHKIRKTANTYSKKDISMDVADGIYYLQAATIELNLQSPLKVYRNMVRIARYNLILFGSAAAARAQDG
jgi:hypothetical protein